MFLIKFLIITDTKTIHFDLPKDANNNLKNEIDSIIKYNKVSVEQTTKNKIIQLLSKYKHGNDIHEHGNSKTS